MATANTGRQDTILQEYLLDGLRCHQEGRLSLAASRYQQLLKIVPGHPEALHLLGVIAYQTRDYPEAVTLISKAIEQDPSNATYYSNRGLALQELMLPGRAIESYDAAIKLNPEFSEAFYNRGNALKDLEQLDKALDSYNHAIKLKPEYPKAYFNRGVVLQALGELAMAIDSYDIAISLNPDFAEAFFHRGNALQEEGQLHQAFENYSRAIALKPEYPEAYNNRGQALQEMGELDEAIGNYDIAIKQNPGLSEAYLNRGNALQELGEWSQAIDSFNKAIQLNPQYPNAYWNKALALLLNGDFIAGWELFEWRWKTAQLSSKRRNFRQPLWLGKEALSGKTILLHSEQGFGDTIQFCRYVKKVADLGANVLLEVEKPLVDLLRNLDGISDIITKGAALPAFDYHCPLLSLPYAFSTELDTIPSPEKYLKIAQDKRRHWAEKFPQKNILRIGIAWSGNPSHKNDHNRSIPLSDFIRYLPSGFQYVSLQKDVRSSDMSALQENLQFLHFGDQLHDFSDTAALCQMMDIVISVDTVTAHLCGAIGQAVWTLLPFNADWRWLQIREDSPWYSCMKLYRQPVLGGWASVLTKVADDLRGLARHSCPPH